MMQPGSESLLFSSQDNPIDQYYLIKMYELLNSNRVF